MSDLQGKTVIVTGSNTGIGRVTAIELAKRGAHVVCANRSEEKTAPVLAEIHASGGSASYLALDLGDLAKTAQAARAFLAQDRPLDVLVNNAGLAGSRGTTKDGFELAFGTNHLGPFLFTRLLFPALERAVAEHGAARVVNVASRAHYRAKQGIDWDAVTKTTASTTGLPEYGVSKLANVLFTKALAAGRAPKGVTSYSLHPGVVATDVWREVPGPLRWLIKQFMITNEEGAKTTLHCATSAEAGREDGLYYDKERPKRPSRIAQDPAAAAELWERSERLVASFLG
jgi:retinol dehydrogenase-12